MPEDVMNGRDDAGGQHKTEGLCTWRIVSKGEGIKCRRTLQKEGMVHKEGIMKGRDQAGGHYKKVKLVQNGGII